MAQNFGSKRVVVGAHYGLRDWLSQRVTAALMAIFTVVLILQVLFGGELDYQRYGLFNRYVIRLIMKINGGPTDLNTKVEFTNWDEVNRFAGRYGALLDGRSA